MNSKLFKSTLLVLLAIFSVSLLSAQRMRMAPEDRAKMLKDSLKLTEAQTKKVTQIYEESNEEMTIARQEYKGDRDGMREAMQKIMKKTDEKISAVLTPEQQKKYEEMIKNRPMRLMGRERRGPITK